MIRQLLICAQLVSLNLLRLLCGSSWLLFLTPTHANQAPNFAPIEARNVAVGVQLSVLVSPTDPDGHVPSVIVQNAPQGARFIDAGDGKRRFLWTPQANQLGDHVVIVKALDALDTSLVFSRRLEITVEAANTAVNTQPSMGGNPAVAFDDRRPIVQPLADQFIEPGGAVIFKVTPVDPDGDWATLLLEPWPAGASFEDNNDGTRTFFWRTTEADRGSHTLTFTALDARDPTLAHSESLQVIVGRDSVTQESTNSTLPQTVPTTGAAIAISAMAARNAVAGQSFEQRVTALIAEGVPVPALTLDNAPADSQFVDNFDGSRTFKWNPQPANAGRHVFNFRVTDVRDAAVSEVGQLVVTVAAQEEKPLSLASIAAQSVRAQEHLSFNVKALHPQRPVPALLIEGGPSGAQLLDNGDGSRRFSWTPDASVVGRFDIVIKAVDAWDPALTASLVVPVTVVNEGANYSDAGLNNSGQSITGSGNTGSGSTGQITIGQGGDQGIDQQNLGAQPAVVDPGVAPEAPVTRAEAVQFLARATFGARAEDIDKLLNQPYELWLDQQLSKPATSHRTKLDALLRDRGLFNVIFGDNQLQRSQLRSDAFWDVVVNAEDQLRQRVAFALSQILVISDRDANLENRVRGFAHYHDILLKHAFGNYRDLLTEVSLNPMMGDFLSSRRNEKSNPVQNIRPDENYARELMQLFTIGLDVLNIDGSSQTNSNGEKLTAFTQSDVANFARVFTGWNYGNATQMRSDRRTIDSEIQQMRAFEPYHDPDPKQLLNGVQLTGGRSAIDDLHQALDNLFNHPNIGPFIARQLIQRLVTSNPSPAYIARVARVFNDSSAATGASGGGQRGDLKAVIKALLLDVEALNGYKVNSYHFGKLKEPIVKIASIWRIFNAQGRYNKLRYSDPNLDFAQQPYSAPSVFNFYSPTYLPPGLVGDQGYFAPEAQILNESTILLGANRLFDYAFSIPLGGDEIYANQHQITLDISAQLAIAADPAALVENLNQTLMAGQMSELMRAVLLRLAQQTPLDDNGSKRVQEVLYVIFSSPEYSVQR